MQGGSKTRTPKTSAGTLTSQEAGYALFAAILHNNPAAIDDLITRQNADVNVARADGTTLVHFAARSGKSTALSMLINAGADIHALDANNQSCLRAAMAAGHTVCVKMLLEAGADTAHIDRMMSDGRERTDAQYARSCGLDIASAVQAVADRFYLNLTARRATGEHADTFVQWMKTLLHAGAPVDTQDRFGKSALIWCAEHENAQGVEMLLSAKADPNFRARNGDAPLHVLAATGNLALFDVVAEAGGDMKARNARGQTPLDVAETCGNRILARHIRMRIAQVDARKAQTATRLEAPLTPLKKIRITRGRG